MTAPALPGHPTDAQGGLAERVAAAVIGHPAVARLDAGPLAAVATHRPGGRLLGVRLGGPGEPVEVGLVLHLERPIPEVAAEVRREVAALCGGAPVDILVADVLLPGEAP